MFSLENKIALVTGAGSGIGAAIAQVVAKAGAGVIVADIQEAAAKATSGQLPNSQALALDVADENAVEKAAAVVGRLDILVNNAGIGHVGTILQTKAEDLDRLFSVNVRGVFNMSKAFL